jgi:hypothetical protein
VEVLETSPVAVVVSEALVVAALVVVVLVVAGRLFLGLENKE